MPAGGRATVKKRMPKKRPRGKDIIDPELRGMPKILSDGSTVHFPKGWTREQRDEFRRIWVERYR